MSGVGEGPGRGFRPLMYKIFNFSKRTRVYYNSNSQKPSSYKNELQHNTVQRNILFNSNSLVLLFKTSIFVSADKNSSKRPSETLRKRNRKQANTSSITIKYVRREIIKQFEQLMPIKYCKSNEKVCPAGPPGIPGTRGAKGSRGRRGPKGTKGKTGTQGVMGPSGKHGKSGMTGVTGPRGEKGEMAVPGPKGMPGPPGKPGESISVPQVMLSPGEQTRDETGNTNFYCTAGGNPRPRIEWRFKGSKLCRALNIS